MSEFKGTKGPWSMSSPPYDSIPWHHMYGPDGKHIMHADRSDEEKIASTRLISAAPDLYHCADLLESLCAWMLHRFGPDTPEGNEASFRLTAARAAIAKALQP